ncbi:hypothetical protein KDW98_32760 [Burkholderia vietnamiensis]|uniref:hypothetical protein n=1 Tax=Burkholderia vietnamiensis TaxID=60552 RepID=UPI001B9724DE|nr:hypothetical protein [Burkholderia vietnamiensis]MBR8165901.1 hypothetical protein [Burkholderia vietnamiensis]MCA8147954.1 hypothetical protein [Burkholderia vietnamiensis]
MLTSNDELLKARIDALETAVFEIARYDPDLLKKVHAALQLQHELAIEQHSASTRPTGFQRVIPTNMPAARNEEAERARVNAFGDLLKNFGAN